MTDMKQNAATVWQPQSYYLGPHDQCPWTLELTHAEKGHWAVRNGGLVLNDAGDWEWEPMPSSRDDSFLERTRFSLDDASLRGLKAWKKSKGME